MKKITLLFKLLLIKAVLYSQNYRPFEFKPYESEIKTIEYKVLDIDFENGYLAFKHIYEKLNIYDAATGDTVEATIDCGYTGMNKYPEAGVILGVYDLNKGVYEKVYTIYKSVSRKSDCIKYEDSKKQLAEAKKYFISKKLDITKLPKPIEFEKKPKNKLTLNPENLIIAVSNIKNYDLSDHGVTSAKLSIGKNVVYKIDQKDFYVMASGGIIEFISAFRKDDEIIFMEVFKYQSNFDMPNREFYNFTPVFKISSFK